MSRDELEQTGESCCVTDPVVLVVEDNVLVRQSLQTLLSANGYRVAATSDGREALSVLAQEKVDIILCDIVMPHLSGYEVYEFIRQKPELSDIPFLFLTSLDERSEVARGKELGVDDYLCKPFVPRELLAIVRGKIERSRQRRSQAEMMYDTYRRRVIRTLSHEFRTPLVAINTGSELLMSYRDNLDAPKASHLLDAVHRGGIRLEKLVADFLILQQMDAGLLERVFAERSEVLQVSTIMTKFLKLKAPVLESVGASLEWIDESEGCEVRIVEAHVIDALDRLFLNALKFCESDRGYTIKTSCREGCVWLSMADRGPGLDPGRVLEAIRLFGQIDRERLEQQGGGLGLPIASKYMAVNGGRLDVGSREGGGAVVSLVVPLYAPRE